MSRKIIYTLQKKTTEYISIFSLLKNTVILILMQLTYAMIKTDEAGTVYSSIAPEFTLIFCWVYIAQTFSFLSNDL